MYTAEKCVLSKMSSHVTEFGIYKSNEQRADMNLWKISEISVLNIYENNAKIFTK